MTRTNLEQLKQHQHVIEKTLFQLSMDTEQTLLTLSPEQRPKAARFLLQVPLAIKDGQDTAARRQLASIRRLLFYYAACESYGNSSGTFLKNLYFDVYQEISANLWSQLQSRLQTAVKKRLDKKQQPPNTGLESLGNLDIDSLEFKLTRSGSSGSENDLLAFHRGLERLNQMQQSNSVQPPIRAKRTLEDANINIQASSSPEQELDADLHHQTFSPPAKKSDFITAKQQYVSESIRKHGNANTSSVSLKSSSTSNGNQQQQPPRKTLGTMRRRGFVPPLKSKENSGEPMNGEDMMREVGKRVFRGTATPSGTSSSKSNTNPPDQAEEEVDERLKNIDPKMIEMIQNEIMDTAMKIDWDDIAGLHHAKKSIQEMVIWPMLRPDIFTGLRRAPKGLLLFGPPGTGKTMIGKCIASNAGCTFFSISASTLTSKWVGEGEKMVRALFAVARVHQPSVIFIDEIDSLLTQRSDGEFEASRRIKTEFLIQFDGAHISNPDEDRILVVGATNRPQEIDEAARRRLIKRFYIPLPDISARQCIITTLLKKQKHQIAPHEIEEISERTKGYSGSDMDGLCREAALGPIREIPPNKIQEIPLDQVRPITFRDFEYALTQVRASVSDRDLDLYQTWNSEYGSLPDSFERER